MGSDIWNISNMDQIREIKGSISLNFLFFETFANNGPFICNHHQTIKQ